MAQPYSVNLTGDIIYLPRYMCPEYALSHTAYIGRWPWSVTVGYLQISGSTHRPKDRALEAYTVLRKLKVIKKSVTFEDFCAEHGVG